MSQLVRDISHLPLAPLTDFSPYPRLEFDPLVQEYCRIQHGHRLSTGSILGENNSACFNGLANGNGKQHNYDFFTSSPTSCMMQRYQSAMRWPLSTNKSLKSCKVVVIGDVAVGKTCLVNRFGHEIYSNKYQTTIGVDFDIQKYNILGLPYVLQIWDTAGLERFKCINSSYYRGCQAAILVFDMSNMSTLANVIRWKDELVEAAKTHNQMEMQSQQYHDRSSILTNDDDIMGSSSDNQEPLLFLVGTKCDLPQAETTRQFIKDEANKIAKLMRAELWFVSSQTGENVNELFNRIAAVSFNRSVAAEVRRIKFETSTLGASFKEKVMQQQKELWAQSSRLIKITKRKDGDDRRSRCINVQCVIR